MTLNYKLNGQRAVAVEVSSVEEARAQFEDYRDSAFFGSSELDTKVLVKHEGKVLAEIFYNGKIVLK